MTRKQLIAAIEREKKKISDSRDRLGELLEEFQMLEEDARDAQDSLEYAIEALSRTL